MAVFEDGVGALLDVTESGEEMACVCRGLKMGVSDCLGNLYEVVASETHNLTPNPNPHHGALTQAHSGAA
jgi:hypothetical protein